MFDTLVAFQTTASPIETLVSSRRAQCNTTTTVKIIVNQSIDEFAMTYWAVKNDGVDIALFKQIVCCGNFAHSPRLQQKCERLNTISNNVPLHRYVANIDMTLYSLWLQPHALVNLPALYTHKQNKDQLM